MTAKRLQYTNGLGGGAVDCGQETPEHRCGFGAERPHDIDELNDTEAALAALVLRDERLVLVKTPGDRYLAQSLPLAQLRAEHDLARRAQGVAHWERPGSKTTASPHNPGSGLSHFGVGHMAGRNRR